MYFFLSSCSRKVQSFCKILLKTSLLCTIFLDHPNLNSHFYLTCLAFTVRHIHLTLIIFCPLLPVICYFVYDSPPQCVILFSLLRRRSIPSLSHLLNSYLTGLAQSPPPSASTLDFCESWLIFIHHDIFLYGQKLYLTYPSISWDAQLSARAWWAAQLNAASINEWMGLVLRTVMVC